MSRRQRVILVVLLGLFGLISGAGPAYAQGEDADKEAEEESSESPPADEETGSIYDSESYQEFLEKCRDAAVGQQIKDSAEETAKDNANPLNPLPEISIAERIECPEAPLFDGEDPWHDFVGSKDYSEVPLSNYSITSDFSFFNPFRQSIGQALALVFFVLVLAVQLALFLLELGYDFFVIEWFAAEVSTISDEFLAKAGYDGGFVAGSLYASALALTVGYGGYLFITGKTSKSFREIGTSWGVAFILVSIVGAGGFTPAVLKTLSFSVDFGNGAAAEIYEPETDQCEDQGTQPLTSDVEDVDVVAPDKTSVVCPFAVAMIEIFVETPYYYVQWGADMNDESVDQACKNAAAAVLARRWAPNDPEPRFLMAAAGEQCEPYANYNHDPSLSRLAMALFSLLAVAIMSLIAMWLSFKMIKANVGFLKALLLAPWAFLSGMAPAQLRGGFKGWIQGILETAISVVLVAVVLALYIMVLTVGFEIDAATWGEKAATIVVISTAFLVNVIRKVFRSASTGGAAAAGAVDSAAGADTQQKPEPYKQPLSRRFFYGMANARQVMRVGRSARQGLTNTAEMGANTKLRLSHYKKQAKTRGILNISNVDDFGDQVAPRGLGQARRRRSAGRHDRRFRTPRHHQRIASRHTANRQRDEQQQQRQTDREQAQEDRKERQADRKATRTRTTRDSMRANRTAATQQVQLEQLNETLSRLVDSQTGPNEN